MGNSNASKTFELILNNLSTTIPDTQVTIFLNSPNISELISVDTSFSLSVSGEGSIDGVTSSVSTVLDVNCNTNIPISFDSVGEVKIPQLSVDGFSAEQSVPLNLTLNGYHNFDISGTAKGIIPKLQVDTAIPEQHIKLPLKGKAIGDIYLNTISKVEIPELLARGKTEATEVIIDVVGSTSQELKLYGTVTGTIPQLKVIGSTKRTPLELDLEGNTSTSIASTSADALHKIALDRADYKNMPILRHTGVSKRGIKLRLVGKATGYLNSIPVDGLTTAEEISLPMVEESNYSISLVSTGKLNIPELDATFKTVQHEATVTTEINDSITLPIEGFAIGKIPKFNTIGSTSEQVIISDVIAKSTGVITLDADDEITIPKLQINAVTPEQSVPIEIASESIIKTDITGTAIGVVPSTTVTGVSKISNLPVSGTITAKPNYKSKQPSFLGFISSIDSGLLNFRVDSSNSLLTLDIDSLSYISFVTESSIISPNKYSPVQTTSSIEKALVNNWYKEAKLNLYGSNTTNPLNTVVNTDDIKYINKGVMWVEEYVVGGLCNTVYNIDKLIGFSIVN